MTWPEYRRKLQAAGYRADVSHSWLHRKTGKRIYPHGYENGELNWKRWARLDFVPPPF